MSDKANSTPSSLITAYKYPFADPRWFQKMLVGALLILASMIIWLIPSVFVAGYLYRIARRIINEDGQAALPEWDDWGKLFVDGIKLVGISFIYSLPMLICFLVAYAMIFIPYIGMFASMFDNLQGMPTYGLDPEFPTSMFLVFLMYPIMGLGILLSLVTGILLPPAINHAIARGSFGAAFRVFDWWKIFRANLGGFMIAYLITLGNLAVLYIILYVLMMTVVLCCLYPFIMVALSIYLGVISFKLYADAYRAGLEKLSFEVPVKPALTKKPLTAKRRTPTRKSPAPKK